MNMQYTGKLRETVRIGTRELMPYLPDEELIEAVNLMLTLQKRPLLIMGEPGCGKTRLAEALAYDLYGEDYQQYYFEWHIKSTTKVKDGLYTYDALRRLYDAQAGKTSKAAAKQMNNTKLGAKDSYFQPAEFAKALEKCREGKPAVLLIDEIDKADIDFPNDLLRELDRYEFKVEETRDPIPPPKVKPIIIITSNNEKELPPAFLRRCLYHFIHYPTEQQLKDILNGHFAEPDKNLVHQAVSDFRKMREESHLQAIQSGKQVSTSELIDWFEVLFELHKAVETGTTDSLAHPASAIRKFKEWRKNPDSGKVPFIQVLLKNEQMLQDYQSRIRGNQV